MYLNKLPAIFALPIMAVLIAFCAQVSPKEIASFIIADGAVRLNIAIITVLFGSMLSQFVNNSGIAHTLIKKSAELSGDNPFVVSFVMAIVVAILFTVLGGLGSVIMVASIVLPIMLSIGLSRITSGCLFLLAVSLGGIFNLTNWQLYKSILKLSSSQIMGFAALMGAASFLIMLAFIIIEIKRYGTSVGWSIEKEYKKEFVSWYAALTPIIPIIFVLGFSVFNLFAKPQNPFEFPIITAMILGLVWGFITTMKRGSLNILSKSIIEGVNSVGPAIVLIIGIGMLLNAVSHPQVTFSISPIIAGIMPKNPIHYIIFFMVLSPLTLYRGPLNIWGMGAGLVGLMLSTGSLPATAIMAALMSVGQIQGVCDPTNTHNVWISNYLNLNVQDILKKTIIYMWVLAVIGLIIAGVRYF